MTTEPKDWVDEAAEEILIKSVIPPSVEFTSDQKVINKPMLFEITRIIRSHIPTPPPVHITEKQMLQVIDERDDAAQALSQAYYLMTGNSPQWSNVFGHKEALEEIEEAIELLKSPHRSPPVPESMKELGLKCVQLWSRREIKTGQLANEATRLIQSFITAHDAENNKETIRVLEQTLKEMRRESHHYKQDNLGQCSFCNNTKALTTHLQKLKEGIK